jgi:hypothetical protein
MQELDSDAYTVQAHVFYVTGSYIIAGSSHPMLRGVWLEELKFNKHCSIFVLFDKKFPILD